MGESFFWLVAGALASLDTARRQRALALFGGLAKSKIPRLAREAGAAQELVYWAVRHNVVIEDLGPRNWGVRVTKLGRRELVIRDLGFVSRFDAWPKSVHALAGVAPPVHFRGL